MEYASKVQKGTIFERCDKNGKVWCATVAKRTPLFVYITIKNPYDGSIENYGERVQICQKRTTVLKKYIDFFGVERESETTEPIDDYYIIVHRQIRSRSIDMMFDLVKAG